jgi:mevalonate pyrophosphate decarboxylase
VRRAIDERDLAALGPILEEEAIELHLIAMSSKPPIFYWKPGTVQVLGAACGACDVTACRRGPRWMRAPTST